MICWLHWIQRNVEEHDHEPDNIYTNADISEAKYILFVWQAWSIDSIQALALVTEITDAAYFYQTHKHLRRYSLIRYLNITLNTTNLSILLSYCCIKEVAFLCFLPSLPLPFTMSFSFIRILTINAVGVTRAIDSTYLHVRLWG